MQNEILYDVRMINPIVAPLTIKPDKECHVSAITAIEHGQGERGHI